MDSYRSVMEVMRFVPAPDILLSTSVTSSLWSRVSQSNELWRSLCEDAGIDLEGGPTESAKEEYRDSDRQVPSLCVVRELSIKTYSIPRLEVQEIPLHQRIIVDQFSAYCHLSKNSLFCCGGDVYGSIQFSASAYEVNILSGEVTELSPMITSRGSHGILKYRESVYVFGGRNDVEDLNSAEQYTLARKNWKKTIGSMWVAIEAPSLCRVKKNVYLIGAKDIELFDLITEVFKLMPLKLPQHWYYNLSFVSPNGTLVVVQKNVVLRWKLNSEDGNFESIAIDQVGNGNYWSNSPLVNCKGAYYGLHNTHGTIEGIIEFDIYSNSLHILIPIIYKE